MIEVSRVVRNKALSLGARQWLESLPGLVADLERAWGFRAGDTLPDATEALVLAVTLDDGTPAVLKLCVPRNGFSLAAHEATVLRLADGEGCVRLLRDDLDRGALLLERLGPSMFVLRLPYEERLELLASAAMRVWRPARGLDLPTGDVKARWLGEQLRERWERLGRPCRERTIEHALACAARRADAHDGDRAVLCHGDVHQWNALRAVDATFKLVDPDGLVAEPEYDLGILLREDPTEGDLHERADWLAVRTGLDRTAIWEWGVVERVSTALLGIEIGLQPIAGEMLAAAEKISGG